MSIHNQSRQAQTILSRIYENSNNNIVYEWLNNKFVGNKLHEWADTQRQNVLLCYLHGVSKQYPDFCGSRNEHQDMGAGKFFN